MKPRLYQLYGLPVRSCFPLLAPLQTKNGKAVIRILPAALSFFKKTIPSLPASPDIVFFSLKSGAHYIRFFELFKFWVSPDGRTVKVWRSGKNAARAGGFEPGLIFLQTNVLSFCLIKLGFEVLHGSCVDLGPAAAAFVGETGYGKSTLAASFVQKNCKLLTDDLLAMKIKKNSVLAYSGTPVIKLWPDAEGLLPGPAAPKIRMTPKAVKHVFRANPHYAANPCKPLAAIYVLWPRFKSRSREIRIRTLKFQDAVISLIKAAHNLIIQDRATLQRQMDFMAKAAKKIAVRGISFPVDRKRIHEVRDRLLKDIQKRI